MKVPVPINLKIAKLYLAVVTLTSMLSRYSQENDGVTYIIAIQHGEGLTELSTKPRLPANAKFVNHPNTCFDIGTVGWVLENHVADIRCKTDF